MKTPASRQLLPMQIMLIAGETGTPMDTLSGLGAIKDMNF